MRPRSPKLPRPAQARASTPERVVVAGRGNLGRSLARALRAARHRVSLVPGRAAFAVPQDGLVFLAVPDHAVAATAARLARRHDPGGWGAVHVSGALGLGVLDPLQPRAVGSFHPLQSFPASRDPSAFRGITVAVDASTAGLLRRLTRLARDLGGKPRRVDDSQRVLYHAAAVFASNFVDVTVAEALRVLKEIGWGDADAVEALMPLVEGAVSNIRRTGPTAALTGPIRRGDAHTVESHLGALRRLGGRPRIEDVYRMLGLVALEIAKDAGLDPAAAERTRRALTRKAAATRRRGRS